MMEVLWWFLLGAITITTGSNIYIVNMFENDSNKVAFSHMVLNKETGNVYVGAMNNLYQLSSNLTLIKSSTTGPDLNCQPQYGAVYCNLSEIPRNTYNKAMVIDYKNNKLIACSNLYHGICERYNLSDIESKDPDVYIPIVGNNINSSVVAFIAPGPLTDVLQSDVLYIANSKIDVGKSVFDDLIPKIASRKLETFDLFYADSSSKSLKAWFSETFHVNYIYGFSSGKFSYFVTVQKQNPTTEAYISKLIRVCQADKHYYSYAEVQLKCIGYGSIYNLVDAAYIAKAGSSLAKTMGISETEDVLYTVCSIGYAIKRVRDLNSALCVYPMRKVRRIFEKNIQDCFDGIGMSGPDVACLKTNFSINDDYCGTYDINTPIDGQYPIQTDAAITFGTRVSAVAVTSEIQDTYAFIGTAEGHIVKIYKLKVEHCTQYTTCKSCLGANDPYCGWCSLENKCSLRRECDKHDQVQRWLTMSALSCADVMPNKINKNNPNVTKLQLMIAQPPMSEGIYECVFNSQNVSLYTPANKTDTHIFTCDTPSSSQLPLIQKGEDHIVMKLSVLVRGVVFVSAYVAFVDCGSHTSCIRCTLSNFSCTWCINNHVCTFDTSDCPNNKLVLGKNVMNKGLSSHNEGHQFCPRIQSKVTEMYVPSETDKKLVVSAINLADFQTSFMCFFNLNNGTQVNANVTSLPNGDSIIECELVQFSYFGYTSDVKVPFQISWALNKPLDNPETIQVIMYKCENMADTCGGCLILKNQYKCGWCDRFCTINRRCPFLWLSSDNTCPNPEIIKIEPNTGPVDGGTYLTITGKNLGKSYGDISSSGVIVENGATILCAPVKDLYIAPVQIRPLIIHWAVYQSGSRGTLDTDLINGDGYPVIVKIIPSRGPKSGGTLVTLNGYDLNAGTKRTVWIGNHSCEVKSCNGTMLTCVTSMASDETVDKLSVQFDKQMVTSNIDYQYTTDPTIISIDPKVMIVSGGIRIYVTGTQLNVIQKPIMVLWDGAKKYAGDCMVVRPSLMHCYSPQVEARISNGNTNSTLEVLYSYGFILDNVTEVLNLTEKKFGTFRIVPDPVFDSFHNNSEMTYQRKANDYLIISGTNLIYGATENDYYVTIGGSNCTIISVGQTAITCLIQNKPDKVRHKVEVHLGKYLKYNVGYLLFTDIEETSHSVSMQVVIISTVFSAVLLIVILVSIIIVMKWRGIGCFHETIQLPSVRYGSVAEVDTNAKDCTDTIETSRPMINRSTLGVLKDARLMINRDWLRFGDIIGKGHFGCVLKGYLTMPGDKSDNLVAVKTLHKKNLRDIDIDAFLREILTMKEFHHPNVLQLLGICLGLDDIPLMVLPFMEHGDLLSYIRDDTNTPTIKDLMNFGIDIAKGMAYLSYHKFVHRDLAARNCMLDTKLNVKVADFGLSREIYEREYYTSDNKNTKLPIRWMAPESIEKGTYNSKSDVWSYGIVLWELMTRGVTPYPEVDNWDIVRYLKKGRRLPRLQYCPDKLYDIMRNCWLLDPHDRPTFNALARDITNMVSVVEHSIQQGLLKIDINSTLVNEADSSKYHYAYDDTYMEPLTKTKVLDGANSKNSLDNSYLDVFDDSNDVRMCPMVADNSNDEPALYLGERESRHIYTPDNSYLELLSDTHEQTELGNANHNDKEEPYQSKEPSLNEYARDDNMEPDSLKSWTDTEPSCGVITQENMVAHNVKGKVCINCVHDGSCLEPLHGDTVSGCSNYTTTWSTKPATSAAYGNG